MDSENVEKGTIVWQATIKLVRVRGCALKAL
jgi:hypothetical protein